MGDCGRRLHKSYGADYGDQCRAQESAGERAHGIEVCISTATSHVLHMGSKHMGSKVVRATIILRPFWSGSIESSNMFRAIKEQIDTVFERDPAAKSWLEIVLCYPGFHA